MQKHPVGDYKILLIKLASKFLNRILIFFLSLILKIDKNKSEIIISNALLAPWKYNENFIKNYEKIKEFTILDIRRLFTIWTYAESVKERFRWKHFRSWLFKWRSWFFNVTRKQ